MISKDNCFYIEGTLETLEIFFNIIKELDEEIDEYMEKAIQ